MAEEKFHCYVGSTSDNIDYFVYWLAETSRLGLTDFAGNVYEATLDRRARKKLLRNVAESLVEKKWCVLADKALKVRAVDERGADIVYIAESVRLLRVADVSDRSRDILLFKHALAEIQGLRTRLQQRQTSQSQSADSGATALKSQRIDASSQATNDRHRPTQTPATKPRRRKVGNATGVVFSDED